MKKVLLMLVVVMYLTPISIILYNLTKYLLKTEFIEWHITVLWSLSFPLITMLIILVKKQ